MPSIASTILIGCLGLAHGERFTVVVDEESLPRALELQREPTRRALGRDARVASMGGSTEAMLARLLDGDLRAPGSLGNVPFGEGFVAPVGGEGQLIATTIAGKGRIVEPVTIEVHDGALVSADGAAGAELIDTLDRHIELDGEPFDPAVAGR
jgi:hypothetical protein